MTLKTGVMLKFSAAIQERHYILKHIINILYKIYFIIIYECGLKCNGISQYYCFKCNSSLL